MPATTGRNIAAALFRCPPLAAWPPAGTGRVGRPSDKLRASWSSPTGRGLCGQRPRPVFAGCVRRRGTPRYAPGSPGRPLQACGVRAAATGRRGHPQLQASGLTLPPIAVTENAETFSAPAPRTRCAAVAGLVPLHASGGGSTRRHDRAGDDGRGGRIRQPVRLWRKTPETGLCGRRRGKRRSRMAQDGRSRRRPCPGMWGKRHRLRTGKHRAGRTRHAACEALRLPHAEAVRFFPPPPRRGGGGGRKKRKVQGLDTGGTFASKGGMRRGGCYPLAANRCAASMSSTTLTMRCRRVAFSARGKFLLRLYRPAG